MPCDFPEHHGSSGGGVPWALIVAVGAVALLAPVIGVIIHVIALVLTFVGIAALAAGVGVAWWKLSHRQPRQMAYRTQTQVRPRWGGRELPQQQQDELAQGGNHLHLHLPEGMHPDQVAAILRRAGGGR